MPHGIDEISKHIEDVDNVPLLVSLFTDARAETTEALFGLQQRNQWGNEVVLAVGSALRPENAAIFAAADVAISMSMSIDMRQGEAEEGAACKGGGGQADDRHADDHLGAADLLLAALPTELSATATLPLNVGGLSTVYELLHEGRRSMRNLWQALMFATAAHGTLALVLVLGQLLSATALLPGAEFSGIALLWLVWLIVPLLTLSVLWTPCGKEVMECTPQKNGEGDCTGVSWVPGQSDWGTPGRGGPNCDGVLSKPLGAEGRQAPFWRALFARCVPTAVLCNVLFEWAIGRSLCASFPQELGGASADRTWHECIGARLLTAGQWASAAPSAEGQVCPTPSVRSRVRVVCCLWCTLSTVVHASALFACVRERRRRRRRLVLMSRPRSVSLGSLT
jgi:hypothetical protein